MSHLGFDSGASPEPCPHRQGFLFPEDTGRVIRVCRACSFSQVLKEDDDGDLYWQHIPETPEVQLSLVADDAQEEESTNDVDGSAVAPAE